MRTNINALILTTSLMGAFDVVEVVEVVEDNLAFLTVDLTLLSFEEGTPFSKF